MAIWRRVSFPRMIFFPAEEVHVIPVADLRPHAEHKTCWCRPSLDLGVDHLYVHNALDERESYENGRKLQ